MEPTERTEYFLEKLFWTVIGSTALSCAAYFNVYQLYILIGVHLFVVYMISRYTIAIRESWKVSAVVGVFVGAIIGLLQSLFVVVSNFSVAALFSIVPQMVITAFIDALLAGLAVEVYYIIQRGIQKKRQQLKKTK